MKWREVELKAGIEAQVWGRGALDRSTMALEKLMSGFNRRIADLQELMLVRGDGSRLSDLTALDVSLQAIEQDLRAVDTHVKSEMEALAKTKALHEMSLQQSRKLHTILASCPSLPQEHLSNSRPTSPVHGFSEQVPHKDKRSTKGVAPRRYISEEELSSLSSYMRGRITLDKVNAAIDEMVSYAEANARLVTAPRKKLTDDILDKVMELRNIAATENVKGKHFFLESDLRGPVLKLDTTGKAILAILRHLGRVVELRIGKHRVFILTSA